MAKHEAAGKPALSGPSLGRLKNTGLRDSTLLELERAGIPDSATDQILAMRSTAPPTKKFFASSRDPSARACRVSDFSKGFRPLESLILSRAAFHSRLAPLAAIAILYFQLRLHGPARSWLWHH